MADKLMDTRPLPTCPLSDGVGVSSVRDVNGQPLPLGEASKSHGEETGTTTEEAEEQHVNKGFTKELLRRILHFPPSWFSVTMGTGITSILLHNLPYNSEWLRIISICIFALNVVLFMLFTLMSIARYIIYPEVFGKMLLHPVQSLFLGTIPMGLATIINMIVYVMVPAYGLNWAYFAWALWWFDVLLASVIGMGVAFVQFTRHENFEARLKAVSGIWLLPLVAAVVASASGGIVASVLPPHHARTTVIVSYFVWGTGVPFAFFIFPLYFYRLTIHHLPPKAMIVSVFLPVGPCGQGSFAILQLGKIIRKLAYEDNLSLSAVRPVVGVEDAKIIASAVYGVSLVVGLILWGVGMFWLIIAIVSVIDIRRQGHMDFNIGFWGFTFPIGVLAVATNTLATELSSEAFKVFGTIMSLSVVLLWLYVASWTAQKAFTGTMFIAPCLGPSGQPPTKTKAKAALASKA